jgi:hypothetical protein
MSKMSEKPKCDVCEEDSIIIKDREGVKNEIARLIRYYATQYTDRELAECILVNLEKSLSFSLNSLNNYENRK